VSNRAKVKLTKLGRRRVDAFYPVVYDGTDQDATTRALAEAAVKLRHLTGAWRVGPVEWRRYLGYAAVVEVLTYLANIGAVPADGRHAALLDEALRLGDRATLALPCQQMLAAGVTTTPGGVAPAGHKEIP
jgi:hypothetical protein